MPFLRVIAVYLSLAIPALAQNIPPWITPYVSDFADVLTAPEEARLTAELQRLRDDPGVEVSVMTIESLRDYGADSDIAIFANNVFNQWGIGDSSRNDGILILVSTSDREIRIALGSGYPSVWDARAQRVIDAVMLPLLRDDLYPASLNAGLDALERHVIRPHRDGVQFEGTENMPEAPFGSMLDKILFGAIIAFVLGTIGWQQRERYRDRIAARRGCPTCGAKGILIREKKDLLQGTKTISRQCPSCGWESQRSEAIISHHSGEDGDGSDGFGGGSSEGGGASGRF